jgi:hypothetical protein
VDGAAILRGLGFARLHPAPGGPGTRVRGPCSRRRSFSHCYRSCSWARLLPSQCNKITHIHYHFICQTFWSST